MLRRIAIAALAIAALAGLAPAPAQQANFDPLYGSGNFWLPKCRAPRGTIDATECISFFYGFDATIALAKERGATFTFCTPPAATFDQAIRITVAYADRNPHFTHYSFAGIIAAALTEVFPCRR